MLIGGFIRIFINFLLFLLKSYQAANFTTIAKSFRRSGYWNQGKNCEGVETTHSTSNPTATKRASMLAKKMVVAVL